MEELRLSFLVFGACAIAGILIHGLWSVRKNAAKQDKQSFEPKDDWSDEDAQLEQENGSDSRVIEADIQFDINDPLLDSSAQQDNKSTPTHFDELGLGEVRVVGKNPQHTDASIDDSPDTQSSPTEVKAEVEPEAPKIYASVVTQPKPEYQVEVEPVSKPAPTTETNLASDISAKATATAETSGMPEPPLSLLKTEMAAKPEKTEQKATPVDSAEKSAEKVEKPSLAEQAKNLVRRKKPEVSTTRRRKEPRVDEDQMAINFDEPVEPNLSTDAPMSEVESPAPANKEKAQGIESKNASASEATGAEPQQEVLVLNVKVPDDKPIPGSALLPMLLTLGFKFGDQDIFHRHVNSNGKGPVLFSLANMFKPGVFDIDNLENFTTQGVSLFMILPIEGDPHQVFNMMHNAARKIADEFSAQVLDGRRSALTKQSLQQYVEKIREFERQRMIAR